MPDIQVNTIATQPFAPLVSIIIPVYNGANYMKEAIDSALEQTYQNIEIIVVNDGSKDKGKTDTIARSYGDKIRYFLKENGGCGSALNFGIAQMQGTYFSWLSHDDKYYPYKIEHQINVLSSLHDKNTIIYGGYELINTKSETTNTVHLDTTYPLDKLNTRLFPLLRGLIHGCSLLIPAIYFTEIGVFDETLPSTQDYALWFDIMRVAPIHFDSKILIQSRQHPDQGTNTINNIFEENNTLWSGFLRKLTHEEMTKIDNSPFLFLKRTAAFLAKTPFKKAEELALSMAHDILKELKIKISVIIPFYNRINLTLEAIQSVLNQTYQNFELLLINDGSNNDLSELMTFIKHDKRIIYIQQEHSGPASARNAGIKHATGDYISFLDSDDYFYPTKLIMQLDFMETNGLFISHTSYDREDLRNNEKTRMSSGALHGDVYPQIISSCPIALPTVMGKTHVFKNNLFLEHLSIAEDVCLWITLTSQYTLGGIDLALTNVRINNNTTAYNPEKAILGLINIAHFTLTHPKFRQHKNNIHDILKAGILSLCELNDPKNVQQLTNLLRFSLHKKYYKTRTYNQYISDVKLGIKKYLRLFRSAPVRIIRSIKHNGIKNTWNIFFIKIGRLYSQ